MAKSPARPGLCQGWLATGPQRSSLDAIHAVPVAAGCHLRGHPGVAAEGLAVDQRHQGFLGFALALARAGCSRSSEAVQENGTLLPNSSAARSLIWV